jgi:AhpD family alkylhydroperoxidase
MHGQHAEPVTQHRFVEFMPGLGDRDLVCSAQYFSSLGRSSLMARLNVPDGPGGEAAMIWTLRPPLGDMVERMIRGAYQQSILPADERELARMRIAQINDCVACSDFRAQSVLDAGVAPELYDNVATYSTYSRYTPRQRLCIEYAERFATDHGSLNDEFFQRLRVEFSDEEILDLTLCVAVFLGLGRSLSVLGVDQSCAIDL